MTDRMEFFMGEMTAHAKHMRDTVEKMVEKQGKTDERVIRNTTRVGIHGKIFWLLGLGIVAGVPTILGLVFYFN